MHRNSNGFGVFARAYVRNSIGRNAQMYFLRKSSKGVVPFSKGLFHHRFQKTTPSLTWPLKNDGWKIISFWDGLFSGAMYVKLPGSIL